MKKILSKVMSKNKKQQKKHFSFLKALRFYEGMPLFGVRH